MTKTLFIILYIILTAFVIGYIDNGIRSHNLDFYYGKDNGFFTRFESIVILNTLFYSLLEVIQKKTLTDYLKHAAIGFISAIFFSVVCYLIPLGADYYGLTFHIVTIVICYSSYFGLKKLKQLLPQH